jgi:hypothetical protein
VSDEAATISAAMRALAARRWGKATQAERQAQARKMVAGRRKAARKRARK